MDEITTEAERNDLHRHVLNVAPKEQLARVAAYKSQLAILNREFAAYVKELSKKPTEPGDPPKYKDPGLAERLSNLRAHRRREPQITTALIMRELPKPRQAYIHLGGDFIRHGAPVTPAVPAVLSSNPVGRMRLEAELLRDSALRASGLFTPKIGGPSVYPPIPEGAMAVTQVKREWPTATGPDRYRRGLYTFYYRSVPHPGLALFDAPDATASCTRRVRSDSPLQALTILNDEAYIEFSRALAKRIKKEAPANDAERLDYAFLLTLGRKPNATERERLQRFLSLQRDEFRSDPTSASLLVVKEQVFDSSPNGTVASEEDVDTKSIPEMAAWT